MKILRYIVQLALGIALTLALQRWDRRRLSAERQAAAWNTASWGAALYAFGPLSMLGWCWVTRRGWRGIVLGVSSTGLLLAALAATHYGLSWLLGAEP